MADAASVVKHVRAGFESGRTRPLEWRRRQLDQLSALLREREPDFVEALAADLGRPGFESWLADVRITGREVEHLNRNLKRWARDARIRPPWQLLAMKMRIVREPLGVVTVIAPWNYPVQLTLVPMAAALAAGNAVVVKPSELTPSVSSLLARVLPEFLDPECVAVIEGGAEETQELLAERVDHILYTGNAEVGRIVLAAAAPQLTPVTLELGGKSPVLVDRDANIGMAAGRIAWGKFVNAGQTCIAPDYVLVHRDVERELLDALGQRVKKMYGDDPRASADFGRIVNERHVNRISALLDGGGYAATVCGGDVVRSDRYIAPTVLSGVEPDAPIMQQEIFGPVLPVLAVDDMDEAVRFINDRPKPLALYVFTGSNGTADRVIRSTSSGGSCINDVMSQAMVPALPFGGVGDSGMGAYHGRWGFELFSHRKSVVNRPAWFELPILLPPYRKLKERIARRLF